MNCQGPLGPGWQGILDTAIGSESCNSVKMHAYPVPIGSSRTRGTYSTRSTLVPKRKQVSLITPPYRQK